MDGPSHKKSSKKERLDVRLLTLGLADSRAKAQALILAGGVYVDGQRHDKAGALIAEGAKVEVRKAGHPFVSRGGVKLDGALRTLAIDVLGLRCLDIGASTGGFTDCLLQRGAAHVVAVDVGYGQLAQSLRSDPRVTVMERTNARELDAAAIGGAVDLVVVDASFIGLAKLTDAIARCTRAGGRLVALVKPQFEVGREVASKHRGVITDPSVRARAIEAAAQSIEQAGFRVEGRCDSPLPGPKGSVEAFVVCRKER